MESINFDDFTEKERYEIITAFLIKLRADNSLQCAHRFFEYYLKQFYKMPTKLVGDIIYCQRAMKSYLRVHQRVTHFSNRKSDADVKAKDRSLLEIEDVLHEINAECQFLVICLKDDIERFCLPFTEQQLLPNSNLVNEMVSQAIVPHVSASIMIFKPHIVVERPTETQLLRKYFSNNTDAKTPRLNANDESPKPTSIVTPNKKTVVPPPICNKAAALPPRPVAKRAANLLLETALKNEVVNASRLHLQAALKRARLSQNVKDAKCEAKVENSKESFMQAFGLCTHAEHKNILLSRKHRQKRKQRLIPK